MPEATRQSAPLLAAKFARLPGRARASTTSWTFSTLDCCRCAGKRTKGVNHADTRLDRACLRDAISGARGGSVGDRPGPGLDPASRKRIGDQARADADFAAAALDDQIIVEYRYYGMTF